MAVVLYARVPGMTLERYDRMMLELDLDRSPPIGAILHIASEMLDSVNVCEVWQTEKAAESFVEQRLRDAVARQGVEEPLWYRLEPLHNMFAPDINMIERIGALALPFGVSGRSLAS